MINGTLLVQAFNFFVGYNIIKYILLKPGLELIQDQDAKKETLRKTTVLLRERIAQQEEASAQDWHRVVKKLQSNKPQVERVTVQKRHMFVADVETPFDEPQEKKLIKTLKEKIFVRVVQE